MPKIAYKRKGFKAPALKIIEEVNRLINNYRKAGFPTPTLRQVYYRLVAQDLIPNTVQSYKRIGDIVNEARLAGLIDWNGIEDRTRYVRRPSAWTSPADIIRSAAHSYAIDKWEGQEHRPEVWIEKDALIGVIEGVCEELNVAYFSCRGSVSQSEMWAAAQRYRAIAKTGQTPVVIHLGDHDPSGIDMTRDNHERLKMFTEDDDFQLDRIALTMEQIEQYDPPPNPAKDTDSRYRGYVELYGEESWELDALETQVLVDLVRDKVLEYRDEELYQERVDKEEEGRIRLIEIAAEEEDNE